MYWILFQSFQHMMFYVYSIEINSFFLKFGSTACNLEELNEEIIRNLAFTKTLSNVFLQLHYMGEKKKPFHSQWDDLIYENRNWILLGIFPLSLQLKSKSNANLTMWKDKQNIGQVYLETN